MKSILNSVKKVLGVAEDYDVFDVDILMHINSTFTTLQQLGIGPENGFSIEDKNTEWDEYLDEDLNLNSVKTYMYLKVRLLFDPPDSSYARQAMADQVREIEWRLNVYREGAKNRDHER